MTCAEDAPHPWRGATDVRIPGTANRWQKEQPWVALRPERVAEVEYDQMEGDRFRHGVGFVRWRPDKRPEDCRYDQLEETPAYELSAIFGGAPAR